MPSLKEQRAELLDSAKALFDGANAQGRDLNLAENERVKSMLDDVEAIDTKIAKARAADLAFQTAFGVSDDYVHEYGPASGGASAPKFLGLAGRGAKTAAANIATKMQAKSLLTGSDLAVPTPLVPQNPIQLGQIPASILQTIPVVGRTSPVYRYLRQSSRTNNAAIVAPGALKPTSTLGLIEVDGKLQVFAHLSDPLDTYLAQQDNTTLQQFVANELLYGLNRKIEQEIVNGDGTAGHLTGILATSGIQTVAAGVDAITTLRAAKTAVETIGFESDVFVVNPVDWAAIETHRATSGVFDLGGPVDSAKQQVWGVPVVLSTSLTAGTALSLDIDELAISTDNAGIQVRWSDSTNDDFAKNQLRARVEGRFSVDVYQPNAVVKITLP